MGITVEKQECEDKEPSFPHLRIHKENGCICLWLCKTTAIVLVPAMSGYGVGKRLENHDKYFVSTFPYMGKVTIQNDD